MIYITGDTHIPLDISKLNTTNFPEQKDMTKNDYLIILGDFGLYWKNDKTFKVIKGDNQALLSVSDSLILASGTVALEAALYQVPMMISYKGPWLLYFIYRMVRCIKRVSLPNIILDKDVVPELIQGKATVKNIVTETEKNLYDEEYRRKFISKLEDVEDELSDKNSAQEVAQVISENI